MIEELLPYYEKQLQEFGQQSREFSQKYPKIAQRLSLNQEQIDDPHIERLIQAFSLIAARVDKKLADSYDIFTRALFEVMFPQYLRHFPSCTVVSFEDVNKIKQLTEAHIIPKKDKGNENKENILILCPNHHKEFDYGKRKIIEHTKKEIVFELNEKLYTIKF
mgnify:CR=1 FL=1